MKAPNRCGMQFASGSPGRIFYIRFDHGEDLLAGLQSFVSEQGVGAGIIHLIGAVADASLVTGPRETILPPDPVWNRLSGAHELIGTGMIRTGPRGPRVHLHASAGRGESVLTGCFRDNVRVYLVIEAVIIEFAGISISEMHDEKSRMSLPSPS
jgi:predicted DNA-binding protein with PD1-like motif